MFNLFPVASDAKVIGATAAIGARAMGQEEVTLLKQILVAIANGGEPNPPYPGDGFYILLEDGYAILQEDGFFFLLEDAVPIDPLAGLDLSFRHQTNSGEITGYRDCIVVSGAGTEAANGRYYLDSDTGYWTQGISYPLPRFFMVSQRSGFPAGQWWLANGALDPFWFYTQSSAGHDTPAEAAWEIASGDAPAPTVTLIQEPQYAPVGLFSDSAWTTPATIGQQVGSAQFPERNDKYSEANVTLQPTLRSRSGVPALEYVSDILTSVAAVPASTAISILTDPADVSGGSYRAIVIGGIVGFNIRIERSATNQITVYTGASTPVIIAGGVWPAGGSVITLSRTGNDVALYINGTLSASGTLIEMDDWDGFVYIGGADIGGGGLYPWDGDIIAAIGYDAADRTIVEAYLMTLMPPVLIATALTYLDQLLTYNGEYLTYAN